MEIVRFLRFDIKSDRRRPLVEDKFCLASCLRNCFIENSQKSYVPNIYLTVDVQLLPCKTRFKFIQYMANDPENFGLKFWMVVDADSKYIQKMRLETIPTVPTNVLMKLMKTSMF